jgi:hypothetical protein
MPLDGNTIRPPVEEKKEASDERPSSPQMHFIFAACHLEDSVLIHAAFVDH